MTQAPDPPLDHPKPSAAPVPSDVPDALGATVKRSARTIGTRGQIIVVVAAVAVAAVGGGAVWGGIVTAHDNTVAAGLQTHISQLEGRVTALRGQLAQAKQTAAQARQVAQSATTTAQAQYASRMASLRAAERKVAAQQKALNTALGQVQASAISADGVYVVGSDIKPGIWHTSGGGQCYYATLTSTNTFDIIDNNNFNGPETVDVSGAYAFDINGGCTWVRAG